VVRRRCACQGRVCTYTLARPRVCPRVAFRCVRRVRRAALRFGALPSIRLDMQIIRRKKSSGHAAATLQLITRTMAATPRPATGVTICYGWQARTAVRARWQCALPFFPLYFVVHIAAVASRRCPGNVDCWIDIRTSREIIIRSGIIFIETVCARKITSFINSVKYTISNFFQIERNLYELRFNIDVKPAHSPKNQNGIYARVKCFLRANYML